MNIGRKLKENISYILWFLFFFTVSFLSIVSNGIPYFASFIICLVLYAVSITTALLFGEHILKFVKGVRPVETKEEKDYLLPIFRDVYYEAKVNYTDLPEIKPYIVDTVSINAFAIGKHTVAITKGAIDTFSEEELKGIISHEIAHIYNGNTQVEILNKVGNGYMSIYIIFINLLFKGLDLLFTNLDNNETTNTGGIFRALFMLVRFIANLSVYIILLAGNILLSGNSRKNEFKADKFAYDIGHGEGLKSALYLIQKLNLSNDIKFIDRLQQTHPRTSKRIAELEKLEELEQTEYFNNMNL